MTRYECIEQLKSLEIVLVKVTLFHTSPELTRGSNEPFLLWDFEGIIELNAGTGGLFHARIVNTLFGPLGFYFHYGVNYYADENQ